MSDVTIHPYPGDWSDIYEYPLLSKELTSEIVTGLPPWIQSFCGVDKERAIELLASRWNGITDPSVRALSSAILDEYHPVSICIGRGFAGDSGFAVLLERNSDPKEGSGDRDFSLTLLIPPPCERAAIERELSRVGFGEHNVLLEFLEAFGGMKEGYPPIPCFFTPADKLADMKQADLWEYDDLDWKQSIFLYAYDTGDMALVHESGCVGWFWHDEPTKGRRWQSVDEFIRFYTEHIKEGRRSLGL